MHGRRAPLLWELLLVFAAVLDSAEAQEAAVVRLTSDNFEHITQAATGQTTGIWCAMLQHSWQVANAFGVQLFQNITHVACTAITHVPASLCDMLSAITQLVSKTSQCSCPQCNAE